MAVVKADGYGHGAVETARASIRGGATMLAVATADEGLELRRAGIEVPILILGAATASDAQHRLAGNQPQDVGGHALDADLDITPLARPRG